jgi:ferric-dicitrate binding protein FerR (iron transport regulator)
MPFFAEIGGDKPENPNEAFDRWREARRQRRRALAHDRAVARAAENSIASPTTAADATGGLDEVEPRRSTPSLGFLWFSKRRQALPEAELSPWGTP